MSDEEEKIKVESEEETGQNLVKSNAEGYDGSLVLKSECIQEPEKTSTEETIPADKPKIVVQRVFQQTENHVVEQKLDYVIANSEQEITKHIYGGLFRNKYYNYAPEHYCKKHDPDLLEHQDETLVKLGDKFDSRESFRLYVDGYAKQWKYYLKCADSHRKEGKEIFIFKCVFAKQRHKFSAAKGLRKRTFAVPRFACPCRVILKPVPIGAKDLTVIYVCNHHDHPLTDEYFQKLQHGRRLHPSVKAELMDLLSLDVDREVVKKYLESLTGYTMSDGFFTNMLISMKKNKVERQFSLEKLKEMSKKVEKIKEELGMNDEENVDNDIIPEEHYRKDKASQVAEVFNVLKAVSAPKRTQKPRVRRNNPESGPTPGRKRQRKQEDVFDDPPLPSPQPVNNQSRLETRLQELKHDQETLQSVKHLQDSVRCETEHNPWVIEQFAETPNSLRPIVGSKPKRGRNPPKHTPVAKSEIESHAIIENPTHEESYIDNQEIVYENEITIMETGVENNTDSIVECVNVVNAEDIDLNENNVSYCIQYDEVEQEADNLQQKYVLLLDDIESFENLPEVQIQATELATVSIVSENNQDVTTGEVPSATDQDCNTTLEETTCHNEEINPDAPEVPLIFADNIHVLNNPDCEVSKNTDEIYEVIQTNDRKIWPSEEVVRTVILNKPPKPKASKSNSINMGYKSRDKSGVNKGRVKRIIKGVTEKYLKDVCKNYLEKLGEDECFMIVVNDDDRNRDGDNSSQDWMEDFDDYETQPSRYKTVKYNDNDSVLRVSEGRKELETVEKKHRLNSNRQRRQNDCEEWLEELEQTSSESSSSSIRGERERELLELNAAVSELKRQKVVLERDIRRLVATKDNLIEDITKTRSRDSARAFKWRVAR